MRGPVYAALPATVREVAEANIYTRDVVAFVEGLGARMEYAVQKNGNYYVCSHKGLEIQVRGGRARPRSRLGRGAAPGAAAGIGGRPPCRWGRPAALWRLVSPPLPPLSNLLGRRRC
jgi:hypothetical protein